MSPFTGLYTSDNRNVTRYILQVHPAAAPCAGDGVSSAGECVVREGEGGFESRELSLQLELGVEYEMTVSTVNCGTQAGNESDPIAIIPLVVPYAGLASYSTAQ